LERVEEINAVYDERVKEILRGLVEGKSREELAETFGHKNYKTLDIFMRRRNFTWNREKQTYIPNYQRLNKEDIEVEFNHSSKAATVISLFKKENADAKTIAKLMGFSDHREMATYMKAKGYRWSSEINNYVKERGQINPMRTELSESISPQYPQASIEQHKIQPDSRKLTQSDIERMERFLPLLEMLERNKDRLIDMIMPGAESGKVPRYVVPGVYITKSVHMTNTLDQLVREYSKEWNISQRDIFTVALIEFFQRYGYQREVETLLGRR